MTFPVALLFSVALTLVSSFLSVAVEVPALPAFMVIGTALWVYFDAKRLGLSRYRTGLINPEVATIGCFGMWIIAFPWYLSTRRRILQGVQPLKEPGA
ncbi:MAG: hypothetical protein ACJ8J0_15010 [Longimicrobiaceae bacterium]